MKIILILVASIFLSGCAVGSMPEFPGVKNHYVVEVRDEPQDKKLLSSIVNADEVPEMQEVVRCLKFDIVSKIPYKIKFVSVEPIAACNMVGGYLPKDAQSIYNWAQDVSDWADKRKKCFR